jgi:outer membrane lipoprotein SlyB
MTVTKERKSMKKSVVCAVVLLGFGALQLNSFGSVSPLRWNASTAGVAAPAPQKVKVTVPAGTRILIRTIDPIDSSKQKAGYRFTASLETNLQVDDVVVAPRGTMVYGRLAAAQSAGRMSGSSQLTLELTDIMIKGTAYPLLTSTYEVKGQGEGSKTAKKVVGGAGLGALIGGIAGGGKGAGIGALAGAGAGTAVAASKKGQQLSIPSETLLEFRLQQPAPLPVSS